MVWHAKHSVLTVFTYGQIFFFNVLVCANFFGGGKREGKSLFAKIPSYMWTKPENHHCDGTHLSQ